MCDNKNSIAMKKAVNLLELVLKNGISPEKARAEWPKYEGNKDLNAAFHILYHFEDDADIRTRDQKYSDWQIGEVKKLIHKLQVANQ